MTGSLVREVLAAPWVHYRGQGKLDNQELLLTILNSEIHIANTTVFRQSKWGRYIVGSLRVVPGVLVLFFVTLITYGRWAILRSAVKTRARKGHLVFIEGNI